MKNQTTALLTILLTGCGLETSKGSPASTEAGCWDSNGEGDADEDINGDGLWDTADCQPTSSP